MTDLILRFSFNWWAPKPVISYRWLQCSLIVTANRENKNLLYPFSRANSWKELICRWIFLKNTSMNTQMETHSTKLISLYPTLHHPMYPLLRWWNNLVGYLRMSSIFKVRRYLIWIILFFWTLLVSSIGRITRKIKWLNSPSWYN